MVPAAPSSTGRFATHDAHELHYEVWGDAAATMPTLFVLHGFCESAETLHVQRLVKAAAGAGWRCAVHEHIGHGLSSGARAVNGSFPQLVRHSHDFVASLAATLPGPFALCGNSVGGALAAFVGDLVRADPKTRERFVGAALLSPAA